MATWRFKVIDGGPTQTYGYDAVNRLQRVDESGGSQIWHQLFSYDQYGNRAVVNDSVGTFMPYMYRTPRVSAVTDAMPFVGNRWMDVSLTYDAAGNQSAVAYSGTNDSYVFDAENRITQSTTNAGVVSYGYDAEGRRAKKTSSAGSVYFI